jgi:hypothetical protein
VRFSLLARVFTHFPFKNRKRDISGRSFEKSTVHPYTLFKSEAQNPPKEKHPTLTQDNSVKDEI